MVNSRHDEQFSRYARFEQALGITNILHDEQVDRAYANERRWQSYKTFDARRNCTDRNIGRAGRHAEERGPTVVIELPIPP